MIYVCVAAKNHATTVGLMLWKIRQVFAQSTREYQLLVADDHSTDDTPDVLQRYQRALPLTVVTPERPGTAAVASALLQEAVRRSDRLKRDTAVLIPGDFRVSPDVVPELLRRIESGADLVVAEMPDEGLPRSWRLVRRFMPWLLRPGIALPGVRDPLSGCVAVRLVSARTTLDGIAEVPFVEPDGLVARAEVVGRLAKASRQVTTVTVPTPPRQPPVEAGALTTALQLRRLGRRLRLPEQAPPPPAAHRRPRRRARAS